MIKKKISIKINSATMKVVQSLDISKKTISLLINGIRYKKETSPDVTNDILKQMQNARRIELETKFHKYGNRAIGSNHNLVIIDKITFDDSVLTNNK